MANGKIPPADYAAWLKQKNPEFKNVPDGVLVSLYLQHEPKLAQYLDLKGYKPPTPEEFAGLPSESERRVESFKGTFGSMLSPVANAISTTGKTIAEHPTTLPFAGTILGGNLLAEQGKAFPTLSQLKEAAGFIGQLAQPSLMQAGPGGGLGLPGQAPTGVEEQALTRQREFQSVEPEVTGQSAALAATELATRGVPPVAKAAWESPTAGRVMETVGKPLATGTWPSRVGGGLVATTVAPTGMHWPAFIAGTALSKTVGGALMRAGGKRLAPLMTNEALLDKIFSEYPKLVDEKTKYYPIDFAKMVKQNPYIREALTRVNPETGRTLLREGVTGEGYKIVRSVVARPLGPRPTVGAEPALPPQDKVLPKYEFTQTQTAKLRGLSPQEQAMVIRYAQLRTIETLGYRLSPEQAAELEQLIAKVGHREMGGLQVAFSDEERMRTGVTPPINKNYELQAAGLVKILQPRDAQRFLGYASNKGIELLNSFTDMSGYGSINGLQNLFDVHREALEWTWKNYRENYVDPAAQTLVSMQDVNKAIREAVNTENWTHVTGVETGLRRVVNKYKLGSTHTVGELADRVSSIYKELRRSDLPTKERVLLEAELAGIYPAMDAAVDAFTAKRASMGAVPGYTGTPGDFLRRGWQLRRDYGTLKEMREPLYKYYNKELKSQKVRAEAGGQVGDNFEISKELQNRFDVDSRDGLIEWAFKHNSKGPTGEVREVPVNKPTRLHSEAELASQVEPAQSAAGAAEGVNTQALKYNFGAVGNLPELKFSFAAGMTREARIAQLESHFEQVRDLLTGKGKRELTPPQRDALTKWLAKARATAMTGLPEEPSSLGVLDPEDVESQRARGGRSGPRKSSGGEND